MLFGRFFDRLSLHGGSNCFSFRAVGCHGSKIHSRIQHQILFPGGGRGSVIILPFAFFCSNRGR